MSKWYIKNLLTIWFSTLKYSLFCCIQIDSFSGSDKKKGSKGQYKVQNVIIPGRIDGLDPILSLSHPVNNGFWPSIRWNTRDAKGITFVDHQSLWRFIFEIVQLGLSDKDRIRNGCSIFVLGETLVLTYKKEQIKKILGFLAHWINTENNDTVTWNLQ